MEKVSDVVARTINKAQGHKVTDIAKIALEYKDDSAGFPFSGVARKKGVGFGGIPS